MILAGDTRTSSDSLAKAASTIDRGADSKKSEPQQLALSSLLPVIADGQALKIKIAEARKIIERLDQETLAAKSKLPAVKGVFEPIHSGLASKPAKPDQYGGGMLPRLEFIEKNLDKSLQCLAKLRSPCASSKPETSAASACRNLLLKTLQQAQQAKNQVSWTAKESERIIQAVMPWLRRANDAASIQGLENYGKKLQADLGSIAQMLGKALGAKSLNKKLLLNVGAPCVTTPAIKLSIQSAAFDGSGKASGAPVSVGASAPKPASASAAQACPRGSQWDPVMQTCVSRVCFDGSRGTDHADGCCSEDYKTGAFGCRRTPAKCQCSCRQIDPPCTPERCAAACPAECACTSPCKKKIAAPCNENRCNFWCASDWERPKIGCAGLGPGTEKYLKCVCEGRRGKYDPETRVCLDPRDAVIACKYPVFSFHPFDAKKWQFFTDCIVEDACGLSPKWISTEKGLKGYKQCKDDFFWFEPSDPYNNPADFCKRVSEKMRAQCLCLFNGGSYSADGKCTKGCGKGTYDPRKDCCSRFGNVHEDRVPTRWGLSCGCPKGQKVGKDGKCGCPPGKVLKGDGTCGQEYVVNLKEVSFSGAGFHPVRADDDSATYTTGQWRPDQQFPVCYTRNSVMTVSAKFSITPRPERGEVVKVRGTGPSGIVFPETALSLKVSDELRTPAVKAPAPLPDTVGMLESFAVSWQVSFDGAKWKNAGTSRNIVYVTLDNPLASAHLFQTVLHLATSRGKAADATAAVSNTWKLFDGPANAKTWNGRKLFYYPPGIPASMCATDGSSLLASGNGQCGSFAYLFMDALAANGISSSKIKVSPMPPDELFLVKDWTFSRTRTYAKETPAYPYKLELSLYEGFIGMYPPHRGDVYGDLTSKKTLAGQNTNPPAEKVFGLHYIVQQGTNYYDPSYGKTYKNEADFEKKAVAGYARRNWQDDPNIYRVREPLGPVGVEFNIETTYK